APRFEETCVVMMIRRDLQFVRRSALHAHSNAALPLVPNPDAVVEPELHFLIDVSGEVVRRHPACVDVERRLTAVWMGVNDLKLTRIPGRPGWGPGKATLASRRHTRQLPIWSEGEIDQLQVMDGDIGARVPPGQPFGELGATDLLRL